MDATSETTSRRWVKAIRRHWIVAALVGAAIAGGAFWGWPRVVGQKTTIVRAERRELVQTVVSSGRVRPRRIRLSSLVAAEVRTVAVTEGTVVTPGMLLVLLDDREAAATLASAEAQRTEARARKRQLRTVGSREAEEAVAQARTRLADARRNAARIETLVAGGSVIKKTLDDARTALALAESAVRTAEAQRADVARTGGRAQSVDAQLQQADAAVALAESRLANTRITAPADGIVIAVAVEVGDVLQPGSAVMELAANEQTELIVELDERNLSVLALDQPALASAEAFPDKTFSARLTFISPIVDERRGTVEIRLSVAEPPPYLRPDMTVSVDIEVARKPNALVLPLDAVRDLAASPWVLVIEEGRAVRRDIEIGARGDNTVEVVSGVSSEDNIVAVTETKVKIGRRVRIRIEGSR